MAAAAEEEEVSGGRPGTGRGNGKGEAEGVLTAPPPPQEPPAAPRLRDTPEDISLEAAANAIALHPARALLAAGDVDGDVYL